jgi:hypothetical protein
MKTVNVKWHGKKTKSYADENGAVRVWDSVAGYYVITYNLTPRQEQSVRARCK